MEAAHNVPPEAGYIGSPRFPKPLAGELSAKKAAVAPGKARDASGRFADST
jgi:hypothetical protein